MKRNHSVIINFIALAGMGLLLSACSGGDGGGDAGTGSLSVGVTDAPVTEDVDVCIHFTGITLHHSDGDLIQIPYDASSYTDATDCIDNLPSGDPGSEDNAVNLSALQGELSVQLVDSEEVKSGRYNWIRLDVVESLSYVMDSAGQQDLRCPSCEQSGLKLNQGIVVPAGGEADFMVDIELAKSLNKRPNGEYTIRPTLRLIDQSQSGSITGSVDAGLIPETISEEDTGCKVYVYEGHDITPDDYHATDNVLTSTKVLYDGDAYTYVAAYLATDTDPTPYTVALTCDADDPEVDEDLIFTDGETDGTGQNADAYTDQTTVVDFPPGT